MSQVLYGAVIALSFVFIEGLNVRYRNVIRTSVLPNDGDAIFPSKIEARVQKPLSPFIPFTDCSSVCILMHVATVDSKPTCKAGDSFSKVVLLTLNETVYQTLDIAT